MIGRRLLRRVWGVVALGVLLAAVVVVPTRAYACSCAYAATDQRNVDRAAVIFAGDLMSDDPDLFGGTRTLTYRVQRVFKGTAFAEQDVVTQQSSASCGLEVGGTGQRHLVFAQRRGSDTLTADLCGGTRLGAPPATLGAGVAPAPGSASEASLWWLVAGAALLVVAGGAASQRRRRAKAGSQPGRKADRGPSSAPSVTGSTPRRTAATSSAWSASVWSA